MSTTKVVALALVLFQILACTIASARRQAPVLRDHALVGRIWDVGGQRFLSLDGFFKRLASARFVLVGERHDNPDHHSYQGAIIRALVACKRRPVVAMEMLDLDDSEAIHACRRRWWCTAKGLARMVQWDESGWPSWRLYEPVLDAVLDHGLPLVPASLPAAEVRRFAATGELRGGGAERRRLGLDRQLDREIARRMREEIRRAHCGYARPERLDAMVAAQRLRDAHMAESLIMAAPLGRAVLIAGLGHVRTDRGVVARLTELAPGDETVSVGLIEVTAGRTDPRAYAQTFIPETLPFDYVWFTARADNVDPCAAFRDQLERLRDDEGAT